MKELRPLAAALAAAVALAAPSPAAAQDDEVYVNPNSPSGVEYDLPLERARRNSDPAEAAAEIGSREPAAVPFGEGIGDGDGGGSAATGDGGGATASGAGDGDGGGTSRRERRGTARRDTPLPPEVAAAAARPVAPADTLGSTLVYAGLGALVVTAGALAGLLLRRRRSGG